MGAYSATSLNLWLPLLFMNFVCALAATAYSYEAIFVQRNMPQYEERNEEYMDQCERDVYFTCIAPWLLSGVWLLQIASCDWVTSTFLNGVLLVLSVLKNLCGIIQSVFTTPPLYSSLIWTAMRTLPERISPARDPVTMWSREEVLERYRIRKDKEWKKRAVHKKLERDYHGDIYPWTSAFEHYLSNYERARLRTRWMRTYAELRMNSENATKAGIISAVAVGDLHKWRTFERFRSIQDQLEYVN
ncbi:hypothetical protein Y032_0017g3387 [Ancylostoma ceylanicum]|nr:hypothetical protein Y032_0017g3387 [Ancylostoma ceylanicum]